MGMKISTQNEDWDGMVDWLIKYIGPVTAADTARGLSGQDWSLRYGLAHGIDGIDIICTVDIPDEKLATLFTLRWV
jgi:hypothetical protein